MRVLDEWLLTPERVAVHLPTATAVVADLHLGYARARRRAGEAVPEPDLGVTLAPLRVARARERFRRLAVAGDLFEGGADRELVVQLLAWLIAEELELLGVVPGNHDRGLTRLADTLPLFPDGIALGAWRVVHGDAGLPDGPVVQGHWHPCLRWGRVAAPCYLIGDGRLVLPAFCAEAAGAGVLRDPRWHGFRCLVIAGDRVLDFGPVEMLKSPRTSARGLGGDRKESHQ